MTTMISMLLSMLKVGLVGFGGGNAIIPLLEKEVVTTKKLISADDYNKYVVLCNITPGTFTVKLASAIGEHVCGLSGMILAPLMMALPGVLLTLLFISLLSQFSTGLIEQVKYASVGISIFIIYILFEYNYQLLEPLKKKKKTLLKSTTLILAVFILTGGKEVYTLLNIDATPLFDISTTSILLVAIFAIFFTGSERSIVKVALTTIVSGLFLLSSGKSKIIDIPHVTTVLSMIMFILAVYGLRKNIRSHKMKAQSSVKKMAVQQTVWVVFLIAMCMPLLVIFLMSIINYNYLAYISKGIVSTLVSFGGGSAYLSVAENSFVDGNIFVFSADEFQYALMPVVQALPGSFLCKALCGVGYYIGYNIAGNMTHGYIFALAGFGISIAASCYIVFIAAYFYNKFENLEIFDTLKKSIRPIVGGLLLSTALSLFAGIEKVFFEHQWSSITAVAFSIVIWALTWLAKKKTKIPNIILILGSGLITIGMFNLIGF